jgi:hypothetical protein
VPWVYRFVCTVIFLIFKRRLVLGSFQHLPKAQYPDEFHHSCCRSNAFRDLSRVRFVKGPSGFTHSYETAGSARVQECKFCMRAKHQDGLVANRVEWNTSCSGHLHHLGCHPRTDFVQTHPRKITVCYSHDYLATSFMCTVSTNEVPS